jgi:hypothetical protein
LSRDFHPKSIFAHGRITVGMIEQSAPKAAMSQPKLAEKPQPQNTPGAADFSAQKLPALPAQYERPFLTVAELQKKIPVSRRTIFAWRKQGWLPSVQTGTKILFHWPSVENALLRQQRGGAQ